MTAEELCRQGVGFHQNGDLAEAGRRYRQALAAEPDCFDALHLLGIVQFQEGHNADALDLIGAALIQRPDAAEARVNYGNVLRALGRNEEALSSYERALALKPDLAEALYNRGNLLRESRRLDEALASYDRALVIAPGDAELLNNRGSVLQILNRLAEAQADYEKALAIQPGYLEALANLGSVLLARDHLAEGLEIFTRHAQLAAQRGQIQGSPGKQQHDREQRRYLQERGIAAAFHLEDGGRLPTPALNRQDAAAIEEQWRQRPILVLDNFLCDAALEKLRRFCWGSTVWRKDYPNDGYLGALLETGFSCPLLGQIAEELRGDFPAIFAGDPLLYLWGFKYDSQRSGVKLHADSAAVNVNFWITPDEANLDPGSGGLIVWDAAAPPDWDFRKFNDDDVAARAFLAQSKAQPVKIPYRANRAVIFDSDLFHETDKFVFKDSYLDRRINITLLYGRRG